MRPILVFIALIAATGSASATSASYSCSDGTAVRAAFSAPGPAGSVRLAFVKPKRSVTLPQVPSADGGRYANGEMEFWIKGNGARLTRNGAVTECTAK